MNKYNEALSKEEWGSYYNINKINDVINVIENANVQPWAENLIEIIPKESKCLEIGCGTGISSLWLAKNGRKVTAIDYTSESVNLVKLAAKKLSIEVDVLQYDATQDLPFKEGEFDYIFQCGLLEHFDTEKQIKLLKRWGKYGRYMVSMIPNAASIAYRVGKEIMEKNNTWTYGLEIPKSTMKSEFESAGFREVKEYTIGSKWGTNFLPKNHKLRKCILELIEEGYQLNDYKQGYLLVTIGKGLNY